MSSLLSSVIAWQGPITLFLVIAGPIVLRSSLWLRFIGRAPNRSDSPPPLPRPPLPLAGKIFLAIHTLYRIYSLLRPPYNIFASHHLPIFTSTDVLRRHFLPAGSATSSLSRLDATSSHAELLLTKLASLDNRLLYSRFGHQPLLECTWCISSTDYLLAALPGILGAYFVLATLLGVLGMGVIGGPGAKVIKGAWRGSASWLLTVLALGEIGVRYFREIRVVEGDAVQLDPLIHTLRTIVLLILPIIYTLALPLPAPSSAQFIMPILSKLQNSTSTLRLTALARNAILRHPHLRERAMSSAHEEELLRDVARRDVHVRRSAESMGINTEMRDSAKRWIEEGWSGLVIISQAPG